MASEIFGTAALFWVLIPVGLARRRPAAEAAQGDN
jgi:hypothetical protein